MTAQQKKVLRAVMACREERLGTIRYRCLGCGHDETVPRSCCNRHCPACQWQKQQAWLAKQRDRLLPCHYFLITFTLPAAMRELALRHPREVYAALHDGGGRVAEDRGQQRAVRRCSARRASSACCTRGEET